MDDSSWNDDDVTTPKEDEDDSSWNVDGEGNGVTIKMVGVIRTRDGEGDSSSREGDGEEGIEEGEGDGMGITGTAECRIEIH